MKTDPFSMLIRFKCDQVSPVRPIHFSLHCLKCKSHRFRDCHLHGATISLTCSDCGRETTLYQLFRSIWIEGFAPEGERTTP